MAPMFNSQHPSWTAIRNNTSTQAYDTTGTAVSPEDTAFQRSTETPTNSVRKSNNDGFRSRKPKRICPTKAFQASAVVRAPDPDAIIISGVHVSFPFQPYAAQREYMTSLIQALQNKQNALLESPTGTGKTLSLLCATLAWRTALLTGKLGSALSLADATSNTATEVTPEFQIIYSSRTHAQLAQVMQELRRTVYCDVRSGILGSRDQFCINPSIYVAGKKSHSLLTRLCKDAVKKSACEEYKSYEQLLRANNEFALAAAVDIEDIANERMRRGGGKSKLPKPCPFFSSRHVAENAEILFMPYNYLLDMVTRARSQKFFKLQDAVVIVDEGHNIAQTCEEAASFEFRISDITATVAEVNRISKKLPQQSIFTPQNDDEGQISQKRTVSLEDLRNAEEALMQMDAAFTGISNTSMLPLRILRLEDIMDRIRKNTIISYQNVSIFINALDYVLEYDQEFGVADATPNSSIGIIPHVDAVRNALLMLFFPHGVAINGSGELSRVINAAAQENAAKSFYSSYLVTVNDPPPNVYDEGDGQSSTTRKPGDKLIRCLCLSPHNALRSLLNNHVRSLIITSGTLSPMNLLTAELGIPLQVQIACRHIIDSCQISGFLVSRAPPPPPPAPAVSALRPQYSNNDPPVDYSYEVALRADFNNRANTQYQLALGAAILKCFQCVPAGVLVFFASYSFMETCLRIWHEKRDIMQNMRSCKRVFVEDRDRDKFRSDLQTFRETVAPPPVEEKLGMFTRTKVAKDNGAVFFAVCRGKVSEGIDFPDDCARAVIIVGIPFINTKDERVILKRHYLDMRRGNASVNSALVLTGSQWYTREAWVAINQAVGRVIRHRDDYGVCIFMDERFMEEFERVQRDLRAHSAGGSAPQTMCSNLPRYIHESLLSYPLNKTLAILRRFFSINGDGNVVSRRLATESGVANTAARSAAAIPVAASSLAIVAKTEIEAGRYAGADNHDSVGSVECIDTIWKPLADAAVASSSKQDSPWPFTDLFGNDSKSSLPNASQNSSPAHESAFRQAGAQKLRTHRAARAQRAPRNRQNPRSGVRLGKDSLLLHEFGAMNSPGASKMIVKSQPASPHVKLSALFSHKALFSSRTQKPAAVPHPAEVITIDCSDDDDDDKNLRSFSSAATQRVQTQQKSVVSLPPKVAVKPVKVNSWWGDGNSGVTSFLGP